MIIRFVLHSKNGKMREIKGFYKPVSKKEWVKLSKLDNRVVFKRIEEEDPSLIRSIHEAIEESDTFNFNLPEKRSICSYTVAREVRQKLGLDWEEKIATFFPGHLSTKERESRCHAMVGIVLYSMVNDHDQRFRAERFETEGSGFFIYYLVDGSAFAI